MFYLINIALAGISFAPFLFSKLDIWHAQGLWTQVSILVLFSWSFFEKQNNVQKINIPLGLMHLWVGINTAFICYLGQVNNKYDTAHFFPYFNFICLLIFYNIVSRYIKKVHVFKTLSVLRNVVIITMFICALQILNIGQFFYLVTDHREHNNIVVGMLGNGTHLSGFLGSCVPLFLYRKKREDYLCLLLMAVILCFTGTTVGDPAISGWIVGVATILFFYKTNRRFISIFAVSSIFGGLIIYPHLPELFFHPQGRTGLWKLYLGLFPQVAVTGSGLGGIRLIAPKTVIPQGKHLHFELFHFTFELGIIGGILILNLVKSFFEKTAKDRIQLTLKSLVFGFLVSSCFAYPAHLWLPATWAMFFYASFEAIRNE